VKKIYVSQPFSTEKKNWLDLNVSGWKVCEETTEVGTPPMVIEKTCWYLLLDDEIATLFLLRWQ
jgi:hypothetical protein